MKIGRCITVAIILLLCVSAAAACSVAGCLNNGQEMRPTFGILVTHGNKPMAGVNFHIVSQGAERFSGVTDETGTVHVRKLSPGQYWLSGDLLGTGVVYTCFHVSGKSARKAKSMLAYTWGDDAPTTSRIAGKVLESQPGKGGTPIWNLIHRTEVPIISADLKLQDPITHAVYVTKSDQDGMFSFDALPSGTYVLRIEGGSAGDQGYDATDQVLNLDGNAAKNLLIFRRRDPGGGNCGGRELELTQE